MLSRLEQMRRDLKNHAYMPPMPEIDAGGHLITYLYECGPVSYGGMGAAPLPHSEIAAWQSNVGIRLEAWESRALRALSRQYMAEADRARDRNAEAPWQPSDSTASKKAIAESMRSSIRALSEL